MSCAYIHAIHIYIPFRYIYAMLKPYTMRNMHAIKNAHKLSPANIISSIPLFKRKSCCSWIKILHIVRTNRNRWYIDHHKPHSSLQHWPPLSTTISINQNHHYINQKVLMKHEQCHHFPFLRLFFKCFTRHHLLKQKKSTNKKQESIS
jgi:hypothetical protein